MKSLYGIIIICLLALILRLPLLNNGYGSEPDAWRLPLTAKRIVQTGKYYHSRMPGHPLQELTYAAVWNKGPLIYNFLTAIFSILGILFFTLTLKQLKVKNYLTAGAGLAFTPLYFIHSVNSMDYIWALSLILVSYYLVLKNRFIPAGLCLGAAIGCRITSGAMLLPFLITIFQPEDKETFIKNVLLLTITACLTGAILYIPPYISYGTDFFGFYDVRLPSFKVAFGRLVRDTYSPSGLIIVFLSIIASLILYFRKSYINSFETKPEIKLLISWLTVIVLYAIAYFRYPTKIAFILPAIPFLYLIMARYMDARVFRVLCISMAVFSFISIFPKIEKGPVLQDYDERKKWISHADETFKQISNIDSKAVIVLAHRLPFIRILHQPPKDIEYKYLLTTNDVAKYLADDYEIYYLPEINNFSIHYSKVDYTKIKATAIKVDLSK